MLFSISNKSKEDKERLELLRDIDKTKFALETAYSNFDNVTEPDLIDCYIYEVNSSLKRYKFLLEQAAKLNLPPEKPPKKKRFMQRNLDLNYSLPYSLLIDSFRK